MKLHWQEKLIPGYALTSTKRYPKAPDTVIVGDTECSRAICIGGAMIEGRAGWLCFRVPGQRRFYFQFRPW